MGSKGSQTTSVNQNQSYSADPRTQAAAQQALSGAQSAASQPFQMPVAPVAGFNPTQQQAFQQYGAIQGMAQPYFDQAASFTRNSAAPITGADVNNYYNPMADNVTAQLKNIYGQQNVQNQGSLTAQAGGVGADRIAVGMGDLANQQGLASGQVYSNLYQQALQAAQQQKQLEAGAGGQFAAFGTGSQNAALQGTGALVTAGNQQQAQEQAQLNAPYQNYLAKIAYQFQTPQYLAGIAGGLAPALGGTTTGQQQTTAPSPSWLSQVLGIGTAGAGLYGALGGGGGSASYGGGSAFGGDAYGGSSSSPLPGLTAADYGAGYAEGGEVEDQGPALPGSHMPKTGGMTPIPLISLPMGSGHSGPTTGGMSFPSPQQSQGSGDSTGSDIGKTLSSVASVLPLFLEDGGRVIFQHKSDYAKAYDHLKYGGAARRYADGGDIDWGDLASGFPTPEAGANFKERFPPTNRVNPTAQPTPLPPPRPSVVNPDQPYRMPDVKPDGSPIVPKNKMRPDDTSEEADIPAKAAPTAYNPPGRTANNPYMMPPSKTPYPDSLQRDVGQDLTRSPWMALIKAGATMAASPGPIGSVIGKGILAGTGSLEGQRKELRNEQELNDKAEKLYQEAQVHLDKYTKMTPYESGSLTARNREIDQSEPDTGVGKVKEIDVQRIIKGMNESLDPKYMNLPLDEKRKLALQMLRPGTAAPAAAAPAPVGPGSSKETALPDPGEGKRQTGKWYIGPSGKPQPWVGE